MLHTPVEAIISRPSVRVNCHVCGEEIMNEREIRQEGLTLCRTCAGDGYYKLTISCNFQASLFVRSHTH
ncbi:MAG: TraR/DksA C4-type zinc finger protein [Anaerolineales bacterium]